MLSWASLPFTLVEGVAGALIWPSLTGWLILIYVAIVPSFLSQVWFMLGVDKIGSSKAGMFTNLVPVFSALLGIQLLGEQMGFLPFGFISNGVHRVIYCPAAIKIIIQKLVNYHVNLIVTAVSFSEADYSTTLMFISTKLAIFSFCHFIFDSLTFC